MHKVIFLTVLQLLILSVTNGQKPKEWPSGEIYQQLEKLGILASVLYVAAHPDDENTRLISYMSNHVKAQTTYLSLTRGDGGQNLIGTEMDELLGVLRTQELLMARSVDNGKQMFSRANDFGYSKNAEETITIWDTEKIKADVVWAIRNCRPDVIINRFDHRTSGKTHGHHTASGLLSEEMFEKAGDKSVYPEQLKFVSPWKPRRLFFNTSWWFYGSQEKFDKADKSLLMGFDVGVYFPLLGKSNTEISAESRSKHKCQGFGSTGTRGSQIEYLELLKGDMPAQKQDIFEGIDITWNRVKGGDKIKPLVDKAVSEFNFRAPQESLPVLLEIYTLIENLDDPYWKKIKIQECIQLIEACSGLYLEAKSGVQNGSPGENITLDIEMVKRLPGNVSVEKLASPFFTIDTLLQAPLEDNQKIFISNKVNIPKNAGYSTPYWLWKKGSLGVFDVGRPDWIGLPETPKEANIIFYVAFGSTVIPIQKNVVYKFNSPEEGELYRPFSIIPPVSVNFTDNVFIFTKNEKNIISVEVTNHSEQISGTLTIPFPMGWKCSPDVIDFVIQGKGQSKEFTFEVIPPPRHEEIYITPEVSCNGKSYRDAIIAIKYDHIPHQLIQQQASAKCINLEIATIPTKIAYLAGAGDVIAEYMEKLGYSVDILEESQIKKDNLQKYDCLVLGVRAYNTVESLKFKQKEILDYVSEGGKVVLQYNTANGLVNKEIGPYPFKISRDRVTVEEAPMEMINPKHKFLHFPNEITEKDFSGWVQERGLYFASEWDPKYETVFSCQDPGESPKEGSLITAKYGKGEFVYTGLSFFRQFPAGVSGAYRLFANIITPERIP